MNSLDPPGWGEKKPFKLHHAIYSLCQANMSLCCNFQKKKKKNPKSEAAPLHTQAFPQKNVTEQVFYAAASEHYQTT